MNLGTEEQEVRQYTLAVDSVQRNVFEDFASNKHMLMRVQSGNGHDASRYRYIR